jgi:hypothetical protein
LLLIDALCGISKLTQNRKGKKILTKNGKEFLAYRPEIQLLLTFQTFFQDLDWEFFCYIQRDFDLVPRLQTNRLNALLFLYEIPDWIDLNGFCSFVSDKLEIANQEAGISVIYRVFLKHLHLFGLVEIQKQSNFPLAGTVRLSELGRAVSRVIFEPIGLV